MSVYGQIEFDGRVQRAAEVLSESFDVTVFSIHSDLEYKNSKFSIETFNLVKFLNHRVLRFSLYCLWLIPLALRFRPHLIYAHDGYTALPAWLAARLTGARLAYDAHELYLPENGKFDSNRDRILYRLQHLAIGGADLIVVANEERAVIMREHHRMVTEPLVVRNISQPPRSVLGAEGVFRTYPILKRKNDNITRIVYQGFMSWSLRPFISALDKLSDCFEFVMVGSGLDVEAMKTQVKEAGLGDRVLFIDKVPRDHVHDILTTCDIGVVSYVKKTLNQRFCAPNKIFEYAQAGLPMITTCQPPLRRINDEYGIGVSVGCDGGDDEKKLVEEIVSACRQIREEYEQFVKRIPMFLADHTWEAEAEHLLAAVRRL